MSSSERWLLRYVVATAALCTAVLGQQPPSILGVVHKVDGPPVSHAEVRIEGGGATLTGDSGEFVLAMTGSLQIGMPAVFHVKGWIITEPCVYRNGRTYLRDPKAEPMQFRVLRPGDPSLKSAKEVARSFFECLIEEEASQFVPKPSGGPQNSVPSGGNPVLARQAEKEYEANLQADCRAPHCYMMEAAYRGGVLPPDLQHSSERPSEKPAAAVDASRDEFLTRKANELGFSVKELESAIDAWSQLVQDPYSRGLAALYNGKYEEAIRCISDSIASPKGNIIDRYVPLARAEYELARYAEAESALRTVLKVHPDDPVVLNDLAVVLEAQAKYTAAESLYDRALAINEKTLGPNHPSVAEVLNNLAGLQREKAKYREAELLYERAKAIDEMALGPDHPSVAFVLNNMALLYQAQARYSEAEPLYKRAEAINETALGPDHPSVALVLNNTAVLYQAQARYSQAEPMYKRALAIYERALGPEHPSYATVLSNLGTLYQAQGRVEEAEPMYKKALMIDEGVLGPDHPSVAGVLTDLAILYQALARYSEAEPLYKRALAIYERALGPEHPSYATVLGNLGTLYQAQGRVEEAEPMLVRSLKIEEEALGPVHPALAANLNNLAMLDKTQGNYGEAELLLKRAVFVTEKALGPDNPKVAVRLRILAELYGEEDKYSRAERIYKQALAIDEKAFGPEDLTVARDLKLLALVDCKEANELNYDKCGEAEPLYKRALAIEEKALRPDDRELTEDLDTLAWFYYRRGNCKEAEPLYRRVFAIKLGWDVPAAADAAENLADTLRELGRDSEAETYEEQAAKIRAKWKK